MPLDVALNISNLDVHYGEFQALWDTSFSVNRGEIVCIIGANGAGKTTLLKTICGLKKPTQGSIQFFNREIGGSTPYEIVPAGLTMVPEGRRIFPRLTVYENLIMGAYTSKARNKIKGQLEFLYDLFPKLKSRSNQIGKTLSGGEQQMLAIGRALMSDPKLVLFDEISLGLAPLVIKDIYRQLIYIRQQGVTLVLIEQNMRRSLEVADRVYVILKGKIVLSGKPSELTEEKIREAYFGIRTKSTKSQTHNN